MLHTYTVLSRRSIVPFIAMAVLLFSAYPARSQFSPVFMHYAVEDGLPSSEIYHTIQDSKGYMWFATDMGVCRYNGYEFESFALKDGLPDNTVMSLFEDHKGRIWFISLSCRLSYYREGRIYEYAHNNKLRALFSTGTPNSFYVDKLDNVYLGVSLWGYCKVWADGTIERHIYKPGEPVTYDIIQKDSSLLMGYSFQPHLTLNVKIESMKCTITLPDTGEAPQFARCLVNKKKHLVFSFWNNLYDISNCGEYKRISYDNKRSVVALYEDASGGLWVGTLKDGVHYYKSGDISERSQVFLRGLSVTAIVQDHEGGYWLTTLEKGVYYMPKLGFYSYRTGDQFTSLETHAGDVYAGTSTGYIYKINDPEIRRVNCNEAGDSINSIRVMKYDAEEKCLWILAGTTGGVIRNGRFNKIRGFSGSDIFQTKDKALWTGTWSSLMKFVDGKMVFDSYIKNDHKMRISSIHPRSDNSFWLGSQDGLWEYDIVKDTFIYHGSRNPLLQKRVLDIEETPEGHLLLGTKGSGLVVVVGDRAYDITTRNGLTNDNIKKLHVSGKEVWAATPQGLNKIMIESYAPFRYTLQTFTIKDGLASIEVNDVMLCKEKVWVATNKGLTMFDATEKRTSAITPVFITSIEISGRDSSLSGHYDLAYDQNQVKIRYTGLSYKEAGHLVYRYKMEGLDTSWSYARGREVFFNALPAGNYRFVLQCKTLSGGSWNNASSLSLSIRPPVWDTWWFRLCTFGLVAAGVIGLFRARMKKVKHEERQKTEIHRKMAGLELKALKAQMNPHFTFNVMGSIQHYILKNDIFSAQRYLIKFSKLIRTILDHSECTTITLAQEAEVLRMYMELEALRFEDSFEYSIAINDNIEPQQVRLAPMLVQPYVENAIRHGLMKKKGKGRIEVHFSMERNYLLCTIEDNGIGREKAAAIRSETGHRSMGIHITGERLKLLNKMMNNDMDVRITDLKDERGDATGTRVEIILNHIN